MSSTCHATSLRTDFEFSIRRRCPHAEGLDSSMHFDDGDDEDDELQDQPRFYAFAQKVESLIRRFEPQQLQGFSWDLGTCLPPEILGANRVVPLQQSSIQSLSLITDPTCRACYDGECEIDLSPFSSLQSLSWKGPTSDNLDALTVALHNNSTHLRNLELDFSNWQELREYLSYFSDDEDDMTALELWEQAAHRHPTLKRFVGHQRMTNTNEDSPHFERPYDVPDLGISGHSMRRIKEDPSQNPLAKLDLEFIGLP
ncbi:AAA family ATPase, partial [Fusarium coicis]